MAPRDITGKLKDRYLQADISKYIFFYRSLAVQVNSTQTTVSNYHHFCTDIKTTNGHYRVKVILDAFDCFLHEKEQEASCRAFHFQCRETGIVRNERQLRKQISKIIIVE